MLAGPRRGTPASPPGGTPLHLGAPCLPFLNTNHAPHSSATAVRKTPLLRTVRVYFGRGPRPVSYSELLYSLYKMTVAVFRIQTIVRQVGVYIEVTNRRRSLWNRKPSPNISAALPKSSALAEIVGPLKMKPRMRRP